MTTKDMEQEHPDRFAYIVVMQMMGEPVSAVGPFKTADVAQGWITQHKALATPEDHVEAASFFVVIMVLL